MIVIERTVDLSKPISTETLRGNEFTGEQMAHKFVIHVTQDGEAVTLTGTVSAYFLQANGASQDITGSTLCGLTDDGAAWVSLPSDCYEVPGRFHLAIYHGLSGDTTCIYSAVGSVVNSIGDPQYDPGNAIGNITQLIGEANQAAADAASALAQATAVVSYAEQTTQTDAQKAQARTNIGAAAASDVSAMGTDVQALKTSTVREINRPLTFVIGSFNPDGTSKSSSSRVRARDLYAPYGAVIRCDETVEYHILYYNTDGTLDHEYPTSGFVREEITVAPGWIIGILARYYGSTAAISDAKPFNSLISFHHIIPAHGILKNKRLSVLGDSISAYAGYIPTDYNPQYTGSNNGVTDVSQMWWYQLCELTGMQRLVINAYSGSGVTDINSTVPMSDDDRTGGLDDGTYTPDVIIIEGGSNDFLHAADLPNEPSAWDGRTAAAANSSFTETYARMVKAIQTNYPQAYIIALSPMFMTHSTLLDDNGYMWTRESTETHHILTAYDYCETIRKVAGMLHIGFIDMFSIGFNEGNLSRFTADNVHPNRFGMEAMAARIASKIEEEVYGLMAGHLSRMIYE